MNGASRKRMRPAASVQATTTADGGRVHKLAKTRPATEAELHARADIYRSVAPHLARQTMGAISTTQEPPDTFPYADESLCVLVEQLIVNRARFGHPEDVDDDDLTRPLVYGFGKTRKVDVAAEDALYESPLYKGTIDSITGVNFAIDCEQPPIRDPAWMHFYLSWHEITRENSQHYPQNREVPGYISTQALIAASEQLTGFAFSYAIYHPKRQVLILSLETGVAGSRRRDVLLVLVYIKAARGHTQTARYLSEAAARHDDTYMIELDHAVLKNPDGDDRLLVQAIVQSQACYINMGYAPLNKEREMDIPDDLMDNIS